MFETTATIYTNKQRHSILQNSDPQFTEPTLPAYSAAYNY